MSAYFALAWLMQIDRDEWVEAMTGTQDSTYRQWQANLLRHQEKKARKRRQTQRELATPEGMKLLAELQRQQEEQRANQRLILISIFKCVVHTT